MKVAVTGTAEQSRRLAERLRADGLDVVECPLLVTEAVSGEPLRVSGYDWVVLTSRNAVEHLFARLHGPLPPVAAIGPGTADALRGHGIEPALIPGASTQEGLVAAFPRPSGRVLFLAAEGARRLVVDELGADFEALYRTVECLPERLPDVQLAVIASGSAAMALARLTRSVPCVSIGPTTTAAARAAGLTVVGEAETNDLDGLSNAVRLAASR